jgi:hypothetical protein
MKDRERRDRESKILLACMFTSRWKELKRGKREERQRKQRYKEINAFYFHVY